MGRFSGLSKLFKRGNKVVSTSKVTTSKSWVSNGVTNSIVAVREVAPAAAKVGRVGGRALSRGAIGFRSMLKYVAGGAVFLWVYSALNRTTESISTVTGLPQDVVTLGVVVVGIVIVAYLVSLMAGNRRRGSRGFRGRFR